MQNQHQYSKESEQQRCSISRGDVPKRMWLTLWPRPSCVITFHRLDWKFCYTLYSSYNLQQSLLQLLSPVQGWTQWSITSIVLGLILFSCWLVLPLFTSSSWRHGLSHFQSLMVKMLTVKKYWWVFKILEWKQAEQYRSSSWLLIKIWVSLKSVQALGLTNREFYPLGAYRSKIITFGMTQPARESQEYKIPPNSQRTKSMNKI